MKKIFRVEYEEEKNPWIRTLKKYMNDLGFKITEIEYS